MAKKLLSLALCLFALSLNLHAHPGGLDKSGGHYDRKTGYYHNHRDPASSSSSGGVVQGAQVSDSARYNRIRDYFQAANAGVIDYQGGTIRRDVSGSQRKRVLARDGHRCVTCGSTIQLEVDHKRALMNGGDNTLGNLATLCDECHIIKTRMDNSLKRKREQMWH
jgi:hypothetical protein